MSNWKYTDATNTVVYRANTDGSSESCLVIAIADWLSEGNTPEPADPLPPPPPKQFTSLEFLNLFTEAEQLAVAGAAMTNATIKLWYDKMLAAGFVTIADPRTEAGLSALVTTGLLAADRKESIVSQMKV